MKGEKSFMDTLEEPGRDVPAIEVEYVTHFFKAHRAVDNIAFKVDQRSIHGFVGPNGAGKTTSLRLLATLLKPQHGSLRVYGFDVKHQYKEVRKRIGFMPDHFSMYRQMTVFEYLDFFAAAYGMSIAERNKTIGDVLALTDMEGRKKDLIKGLSRGMQQRVSLARVLVHDPKLLLLDEPASGLDPRARIELMEILMALKDLGKTIFISSHILSELAELCDAVTIVDRGQVKYSGTMQGLLEHDLDHLRYNVRLYEPCEGLEDVLQLIPGVISVKPLGEFPGVKIAFDGHAVDTNHVIQAVIGQGALIQSFAMDARHLNQAFMDLTEAGVRQ
ncbi:MAG: ABC-2 type transport system ATP-binding protein [Kiritimatiellia bacterium]|jgi:ABC-2 type transport system ATP-binding protein